MERMRFTSYLLLNLLYWLPCLMQYFLAKAWLRQIEGVSIFFAFMGIGFLVISFFDYLCARLFQSDTSKEPSAIDYTA